MEIGDKDDYDLNKYTYFVNENPTNSGDWYELPPLDNNLIVQSQKIKRIISGDYNLKLVTNPAFDGPEKSFLRAQIARITHSTTLMPDGLQDKDEESGNCAEKGDDKEFKSTQDLINPENWVFSRPGILPSGNLKAKETTEEEEEGEGKEAKEATMERLVKLEVQDKDNWKIILAGLADTHKLQGAEAKEFNYGVNILTSLRWPGAMAVHYMQKYHNF